MATNPLALGLDPRQAAQINPLSSAYWGQGDAGDGTGSLGDGRGGIFDWSQLGGLGYDTSGFYRSNGDNESPQMQAGNPQEVEAFLQAQGLQIMQQPLGNNEFANYLVDQQGQVVGEPFRGSNSDPNFSAAAMAAVAAVTAGVGGGYFGGGELAASGGIPLSAAEMGVGSFPAGMEGFGFANATGAGAGAAEAGAVAGGGLTAGASGGAGLTAGAGAAGSLYAPAGYAAAGMGAAGAAAAGGGGGAGGLLASLGSAN